MFMVQAKSQVKPVSGGKRKTAEKQRNFSHLVSDGVIQRVKFQYYSGRWNAIGDFDQGSGEVPEGITAEEGAIYDTVTGEYISSREAHERAFDIISTARQHQQQRNEIAQEIGQPLPPRNRSEMYSTTPMETGPIDVENPYGKSIVKAGVYTEKGGSRKQPLVVTPGVPRSYKDQTRVMDRMPQEKRRSVFSTVESWASGTDSVEAPKDLIESMSDQEKKVASQLAVSVAVAEAHDTRAMHDGGKTARASFRMAQHYPVGEVLHPQSGANIMARRGGNQTTREIFSDVTPHTPTRQTSLAPLFPFLSPKSPSPQRPAAMEEERSAALTDEECQLWHPAAIKIAEYMSFRATSRERDYFERQIGLETIGQWIEDPHRMTREGIGKMMQFL